MLQEITMDLNRKENNRIRLLHLVDGLKAGGAELLITHIIKALGTTKYEHYVYYFADDGPVREMLEAFGIPVYKGKERASIIFRIPARIKTAMYRVLI